MKTASQADATLCVIPPDAPLEGFASLSIPVYRASTIVFPTAAAYRKRHERAPDGYTYGLAGTPTTRTLEAQIAALHMAERTIVVPSGQAAISTAWLSVLKTGDHVLLADNVYPPVKQMATSVLNGLGIQTEFFDPTLLDDVRQRLRPGQTTLVWVESPGSTSMEVCDVPSIAQLCKKAGALLGCDNTWATGLLCKPLTLGVDIVAEALTKYVGGHSDLLMGAIVFRDLNLYRRTRALLTTLGIGVSPDDASLALRGMQTMSVRLQHVSRVAEDFAKRLASELNYVVLHPCLPHCSGHSLWCRDFKGSAGVLSLRLDDVPEGAIDRALDGLKTFAIGASWGGTRSVIAPIVLSSDRHVVHSKETTTYIRISIGLEDPSDLWADLVRFSTILDKEVKRP
ncbi:aminotransferase class I/II-fold pyridoxal phosphate-dependent enzyme [Bradyrhizobium sp. BEA-2-5]|uniref:trans-sulfuration enzyme family protein n=1 Tax=Bradyrhizobium sp. BEA-2-5 TaxID=3080015 RepID=UPI00293E39A0|nr:PLP-dependent transferase [Bradyrhizobium sp. BEA-2-5]WOH80321.1 aminotransferase class I/II-fold pyridoxal phosphate-dependent enzyme [Bradyrhizobium sp. BEA-2-5]